MTQGKSEKRERERAGGGGGDSHAGRRTEKYRQIQGEREMKKFQVTNSQEHKSLPQDLAQEQGNWAQLMRKANYCSSMKGYEPEPYYTQLYYFLGTRNDISKRQ